MLRLLVANTVVPSSSILVTLMMEVISSFETSVLRRATRRNITEDGILQEMFLSVNTMEHKSAGCHAKEDYKGIRSQFSALHSFLVPLLCPTNISNVMFAFSKGTASTAKLRRVQTAPRVP
jgi:hypothetical protein